jgi:NAD(P)-dependent dehydrogenase (short-subunit alcohol dehydrogenase family)
MHVFITGASQGIGAAIAELFAQTYGADLSVTLVARSEGKLREVAGRCEAHGAKALVAPADVTSEAAVTEAAEAAHDSAGPVDVLVNNAGSFTPGGFFETTSEQFLQQLHVNLTSAFYVSQSVVPAMLEAGRGHVFFVASVAAIRAYAGGVAYCAAKHGMLGLARVLREETKESGVRVTTLLPGATLTPSWDGTDLPQERFMPAEDIAQALLDAYRLSPRTVMEEVILRPQQGDI